MAEVPKDPTRDLYLYLCTASLSRHKICWPFTRLPIQAIIKALVYYFTAFVLKVKVKVTLEQATKAQRGSRVYSSTLSLTSALVVNATPRPLYPRERPGTHCIGGWVGPRAGLDR
jgi:hypothetical protein